MGLPPRPRARRPGLRPGQAGAAERDPRPLALGADRCSAARRPTPATPRSSPTTAPPSRRRSYLQPLLDGEISSCFSMTEPQGGADPTLFTTRAERDGDEWVINGEKWFSSNARFAAFLIVMAVTDPDVSAVQGHVDVHRAGRHARHRHHPQRRASATSATEHGTPRLRPLRRTCGCRRDNLLGDEGGAFVVAQTRLGGGRIHHAMRTVAQVRRAFDMMCERALSRQTAQGTAGDEADGAGEDRRQLDRDRAVPAAGAAHRVADRQAQGLQAGPQGHRRGQGRRCPRCCTTSRSARCTCTARSASPTRCRSSTMMLGAEAHGPRRRADRGAQGHRRPPGAARATSRPTACSPPRTSPPAAPRPAPASPNCSSTSRQPVTLLDSAPTPVHTGLRAESSGRRYRLRHDESGDRRRGDFIDQLKENGMGEQGARITQSSTVAVATTDQDAALRLLRRDAGPRERMEAPFGDGQRWIEVARRGGHDHRPPAQRPGATVGVDTGIRLTTEDAGAAHTHLAAKGSTWIPTSCAGRHAGDVLAPRSRRRHACTSSRPCDYEPRRAP